MESFINTWIQFASTSSLQKKNLNPTYSFPWCSCSSIWQQYLLPNTQECRNLPTPTATFPILRFPKTPEVGYNPFPAQLDILPHYKLYMESQIAEKEVRQPWEQMVIRVSTLTPRNPDYSVNYPRSQNLHHCHTQETAEKIRRILNEVGVKVAIKHTVFGPLANIYLPLRILLPLKKLLA